MPCGMEMQNSKCRMQNNGVRFAHDENHFRRKYHNSAFYILHSTLTFFPLRNREFFIIIGKTFGR